MVKPKSLVKSQRSPPDRSVFGLEKCQFVPHYVNALPVSKYMMVKGIHLGSHGCPKSSWCLISNHFTGSSQPFYILTLTKSASLNPTFTFNPSSIHSFATEITCEAMASGPLSGHQPTVYSEAERSRPKCTATRLRGRLLYTLPPARHTALLSYLPTIRTPFPGHSASSLLAHNL